jgi:HemY protein
MIRTFFIFAVLLASICLGIQLSHDPGYLLIAVDHWTMETTLWVAIPSILIIFLLLHCLLLIVRWLIHTPTVWRQWLEKRRIQLAQAKTRQGLIEFSEGHWQQAQNHLMKALPFADTPLLNYLTAARAAQEMGDNKLRDEYLREAQQSMPEAKIAVELTQAQLQLANQQWEQALATLRHLQDLSPQHPYVLKLLMHLYEEVNDWPQLITLLPMLKRHQILSEPAYNHLQQRSYNQALIDLIKQNQPAAITQFIKNLPKNLACEPSLMYEYCQYLLRNHEDTQAESILRRCLHQNLSTSLIDLYGQINANVVQLNFAESLLKTYPLSAALHLCLGRICQAKHLWGKAKIYFEESLKLDPTPIAYVELGQLLEQLNDQPSACHAYRKGLLGAIKESRKNKLHDS